MLPAELHVVPVVLLAGCLIAMDTSDGESDRGMEVAQAVKLLDSEDGVVAGDAALMLGRSKDVGESAIRALVEHLGDARAAEVRPAGVGVLDSPPTVGDYASNALVRMRTDRVVTPVCQFLDHAKRDEARIRAIQTLCGLGRIAPASVSSLAACAQDKNAVIRCWTITAIASVSASPEQTIALLRRALRDDDANVKAAAVLGLGSLGPKAVDCVPQLLPLLDSPELRSMTFSSDCGGSSRLCLDVAMALGKIGPAADAAIPQLQTMLQSKDPEVRVAAAFAHCQISAKRKPGLDILLEELEDGPVLAARASARVLGQLTHKSFAEPVLGGLRKALKHSDGLVRCRAAESIAKLAPPDLVRTLRPLARDPDGVVQDCVLEILSEHAADNPDLVEVFVRCLARKTEQDCAGLSGRQIAAEALGRMGSHAEIAIPLLRQCAEGDDNEAVRDAAKAALRSIAPVSTGGTSKSKEGGGD
jgi:HEAT repeat protein